MWTSIFNNVDDHTSLVVHVYLLSGDILATIAVGAGIVWEGIFDIRHIAHRLVVWGVVAETLCSVALFTFDEGISGAQQAKIISLKERLAPRALSPVGQQQITDAAKMAPNIDFDKGVTPGDADSYDLMASISKSLVLGGWHKVPWRIDVTLLQDGDKIPMGEVTTEGVWFLVSPKKANEVASSISTIQEILQKAGIAAHAAIQRYNDSDNSDFIHVIVGKKPAK